MSQHCAESSYCQNEKPNQLKPKRQIKPFTPHYPFTTLPTPTIIQSPPFQVLRDITPTLRSSFQIHLPPFRCTSTVAQMHLELSQINITTLSDVFENCSDALESHSDVVESCSDSLGSSSDALERCVRGLLFPTIQ